MHKMIASEPILPPLSHWLPNLMLGIAVLLVFWLLARLISQVIAKVAKKSHPNKAYVLSWLGQLAKNTLLVIGLIAAASAMGINVSALVASLGLTGVAIGIAMKEPLGNLLAGTLVLVYPPVHLGDFIKVADFEGEVFAINLRYTSLKNQGERILIPNMTLLSCPIIIREKTE